MFTLASPLCSRWSSFLLVGIFLTILGALALSSVFVTTIATVLFLGALITAGGISLLIHAFWAPEWRGFFAQLITGILSAVVGWLMITHPAIGALSITILLAALFIASGLFRIVGALTLDIENWGWMLVNGLVTLALGILIFAQWPEASLWVIGLFIGIDLLFSGWTNVLMGLMLRKKCALVESKPKVA